MTRVAAIQMVSSAMLDANLEIAAELIGLAAKEGAKLVSLPENFACMGKTERDKLAIREPFGQGPIQNFLAVQAKQHRLWLAGGTIYLSAKSPDKARAACLIYDPNGGCVARYDKIHLFDVTLATEANETYRESDTLEAGNEVVVTETPLGKVGISICYDLRFPELYRRMHDGQVELILVPSAFTETTGAAHWEILLRTRSVENLCYVIASNQGGQHANKRTTWGHSMIVNPWGEVLDRVEKGPGLAIADIDVNQQRLLRKNFPCIEHRKIIDER